MNSLSLELIESSQNGTKREEESVDDEDILLNL
jgi:hypothetical protein